MSTTMSPERTELGRFFAVTVRQFEAGQTAPEMFSAAIDAEWHRLLNDPEYAQFCSEHADHLIGHVENKGTGPISWVSAYEEMFGPLPKIWFTGKDGQIDTEALARYRQTGVVVAEWDCTPTGGDDDDFAPKPRKAATR
ncbi:hypothetical protein [Streptomyces sp. NPDC001816]|uniref:hypothetical protein n=1 Tax=Streptomyces sp. NPDC001816 TaxID=3364612 RepID=UPI0036CBA893